MAQPGFWDNPESARQTVEQLKLLKAVVEPVQQALDQCEELTLLWEMAQQEDDQQTRLEVARDGDALAHRLSIDPRDQVANRRDVARSQIDAE